MTTNETDLTPEQMDESVETARDILRRRVDELEHAKAVQPERLAQAREDADEARGWALLEEPFDEQWTAIPGYSRDGDVTAMLALPNLTAKELWGARLCFDLLDCGDDEDRIDEVLGRLFSTVHGDTGMAFLIATSALSTIASLVVPQLLDEIECRGSNYDERVRLAEARVKSWNGRVSEIRSGNRVHDGDDDAAG